MTKETDYEKIAYRVSFISILANAALTVFKLLAGFLAHSGAMISDAIHSASDVFSTIIVIIGIRISGKDADNEHPYGHERLECVASIILATVLCMTGLGIGIKAVNTILAGQYDKLVVPGILAMIAAIVSIVTKEAMFWYTRYYAKKIDSSVLMADAWHHRSDSFSSIGALVGIAGSRLGFPILDSVASLVICGCIVKAAYDIFSDAINQLVDKACAPETEEKLHDQVLSVAGVEGIDLLHTRVFGNRIYVDLEITVIGDKTLWEAHAIAEQVHDLIEKNNPKVKHIMVHVNPVAPR